MANGCEKMLNITNCRNANENPRHILIRRQQVASVGEGMEKEKLCALLVGM